MKYRVLHALKEAYPDYVSGEALSGLLNVSRTAVWKYINELRIDNYEIEASTRNGYRLARNYDRPNGYEISYNLGTAVVGRNTAYFDILDSTNNYAKQLAAEGCEDGTSVIAGSQTAGRGRIGKKWESPQEMGIYLSIVLRPEIPPDKIQLLTLAASVAVAEAIRNSCGLDAGIKWPNDVILEGKKVCGILTEMNCETDAVNYAVIGIGVNYCQSTEDFPEELKDKAISLLTCLKDKDAGQKIPGRTELIRALLVELDRNYALLAHGSRSRIIQAWKEHSLTLGKEVSVLGSDGCFTGTALDIADDGRLIVCSNDGVTREVLSGEISVRGLLGYT